MGAFGRRLHYQNCKINKPIYCIFSIFIFWVEGIFSHFVLHLIFWMVHNWDFLSDDDDDHHHQEKATTAKIMTANMTMTKTTQQGRSQFYQNKWIYLSFKLDSHIFWQGGFFLVMVLITSHFRRLSGLPYARSLHLHQTYGVSFWLWGPDYAGLTEFFAQSSPNYSLYFRRRTLPGYIGGVKLRDSIYGRQETRIWTQIKNALLRRNKTKEEIKKI